MYAPPVARLSPIALRDVKPDRGNPPQSPEEGEIEYNTYGWFNFDSDAEGVRRLDAGRGDAGRSPRAVSVGASHSLFRGY